MQIVTIFIFSIILIVGWIAIYFNLNNNQRRGYKSSAAERVLIDNCSNDVKEKIYELSGDKMEVKTTLQLRKINNEIQKISNELKKNSSSLSKIQQSKKLINLLAERKKYLISVIRRNPNKALYTVFSPKQREELLKFVPTKCIETPITVTGKLKIIHADSSDKKSSKTEYLLIKPDRDKLILHLTNRNYLLLISGKTIKVNGYKIDKEVLIDNKNGKNMVEQSSSKLDQKKLADSIGEQNVVTLMINYRNTSQPQITKDQLKDIIFTKTNNYYKENSYQKTSLKGDIYGLYTIDVDQSCDTQTLQDLAVAKADIDVNFSTYNRLIIIAPMGPGCWFAGMGTIGKTEVQTAEGEISMSISWDVAEYLLDTEFGPGLVQHELGHNFGLYHANFIECPTVNIDDYNNCNHMEYGDPYDVMGWTNLQGHLNVPQKEYLGWLEESNIKEIKINSDNIIEPLELTSTNPKAIKIQRSQSYGVADYLFFEYRQPIGFDQRLNNLTGSDVFQGALPHLGSAGTYLFDTTPPGSNYTTALLLNSYFIDPSTGAKISLINKTSDLLTLRAELGKTDFVPPTVMITAPLPDVDVSGPILVSVNATDDQSGIDKVELNYANYENNVNFATFYSPPYTSQLDTRTLPNGTSWLYATAYDRSGKSWSVPGNIAWSDSIAINVFNYEITPTPTVLNSPTPIISPTPTSSPRASFEMKADQDACVTEYYPNEVWPYCFATNQDNSNARQRQYGFILFKLKDANGKSLLSADRILVDAKIGFVVSAGYFPSGIANIQIYEILEQFNEQTLTWNNKPTLGSLQASLQTGVNVGNRYEWNLTNLLNDYFTKEKDTLTLVVKIDESTQGSIQFEDKNSQEKFNPRIVVTHDPRELKDKKVLRRLKQ